MDHPLPFRHYHPRRPLRYGWLHVVLPLLVGGLLYILYRPTSLLMFAWFAELGLEPVVTNMRTLAGRLGVPPDFVVYSLPGGLWAYSLLAYLRLALGHQPGRLRGWLLPTACLLVALELVQLASARLGVFSPADLLTTVGAIGLFLTLTFRPQPAVP